MILFASCVADEPDVAEVNTPLVVEGWIEEGDHPVVIVTHAVDLTQDAASFDGVVEQWCRVSVYDGDTRYLLTGHIDDSYTPRFIYTHKRLRGQQGHTYRLVVETETDTLTAVSTIGPVPTIESLEAVPHDGGEYSIRARLRGVECDGYYKLFGQSPATESRFYGTFMGTFAGCDYDEVTGVPVTRGVYATYSGDEFSHYYRSGERVTVKICSLDRPLYHFWREYDKSVSLSGNLFFTFADNCTGNIAGGLGYWGAYGTACRTITLP